MRAVIQERDDALVQRDGVTVCIPTHNDAHVLQTAIESALVQTVSPLEIIVVDDGSENEVKLLVDEDHPDKFPHIDVRVVRVTNRGLPAARNTGLMLARTEAIVFLDADDTIDPTFIEKTLPFFQDGADVVLVGLQEHGPTRNGHYDPGYDRPFHLVDVEALWRCNLFFYCALMRVSVIREVGGYHPAMSGWPGVFGGYEDWDMWITLMNRGVKFEAVNEPLLNYTTKPDSMVTRAQQNREALVAEMRLHHCRT